MHSAEQKTSCTSRAQRTHMAAGLAAGGGSNGAGGASTAAKRAGSARPSAAKYAHRTLRRPSPPRTATIGTHPVGTLRVAPRRCCERRPCSWACACGSGCRPSSCSAAGLPATGAARHAAARSDADDVAALHGKLLVIGGVRSYHPLNKRIYSWGDN